MNNLNIWYDVFHLLDFKSQLSILVSASLFRDNLKITDLYNLTEQQLDLLTDDFLREDIFRSATKLIANYYITDISYLTHLKQLCARRYCALNQSSIEKLDLIELNIGDNRYISDISWMRNLKVLYAYGSSLIDQAGVMNLELTELYVNHNEKIYDVSFMRTLKVLYAAGNSGIDQIGIRNLDLYVLNSEYNEKIHDISHMKNLKTHNFRIIRY